jgi:hypothetical protein
MFLKEFVEQNLIKNKFGIFFSFFFACLGLTRGVFYRSFGTFPITTRPKMM